MKTVGRIFLWICFLPFMLTYWGLKNNKLPALVIGTIMSVFVIVSVAFDGGDEDKSIASEGSRIIITEVLETSTKSEELTTQITELEPVQKIVLVTKEEPITAKETVEETEPVTEVIQDDKLSLFDGYQMIEVDGGNLSGYRQSNVVVDVGYGDREYWAFTNEHGQLVKVIADEIVLQNDEIEPVNSHGRYYPDEAKVDGVESPTLDEGHVIADSLGGVSNSYNITPQDSLLNQHGDQAYMEYAISNAGGCTDFVAIITYTDTETMIPNHYSYTYTLKGNVINDEFSNGEPKAEEDSSTVQAFITKPQEDLTTVDKAIVEAETTTTTQAPVISEASGTTSIEIIKVDKKAEIVVIKNTGIASADIGGWTLISERGADQGQMYTFPGGYTLRVGESITLIAGKDPVAGDGEIIMARKDIWNNSKSDPAVLINASGVEVDRK